MNNAMSAFGGEAGHQHGDDFAFRRAKGTEVVRRCDFLEELAVREREDGPHLVRVRRRLAAFSRSACWAAHLSTSEFTRFCSSSFSSGDSGRGAGAEFNSLLKFNPRKKSLSPSMIVKIVTDMLAKALCQFLIRIVRVAPTQPEQQFVRLVRPI
jgi:hypothetical protein